MLAFGIELGQNPNCKLVAKPILDPFVGPHVVGCVIGCLLVPYCWATRLFVHPCLSRSSSVIMGVRGRVRSPTSASDMAIVEFIRVWQILSYELAFGSELGPNPNCNMVSEFILDPFVGPPCCWVCYWVFVSPVLLGHPFVYPPVFVHALAG